MDKKELDPVLSIIKKEDNITTSLKGKLVYTKELYDKFQKEKTLYNEEYLKIKDDYDKKYFELMKKANIIINTNEEKDLNVIEEDVKGYLKDDNKKEEKSLFTNIPNFWQKVIENSGYFSISKVEKEVLSGLREITLEKGRIENKLANQDKEEKIQKESKKEKEQTKDEDLKVDKKQIAKREYEQEQSNKVEIAQDTKNEEHKDILVENKLDFRINFYFNENKYFKNTFLTKTYIYDEMTEKVKDTLITEIKFNKEYSFNNFYFTTNEHMTRNFFEIFDPNGQTNELNDNEANFFKNDLMVNFLEYYLQIGICDNKLYNTLKINQKKNKEK